MPETKTRNHYIPKTYLEKFFNQDTKLFVYMKGEDFFKDGLTKTGRLLTIEGVGGLSSIAVKKNLYIPEGDIAEDKNMFEDWFAQEVEAKYNEFVAFVEANFSDATAIFEKYRDYIILLIASMMSRTLHSKIEMEDIYKVNFQAHNWAHSSNPNRNTEMKELLKEKDPDITDEKAEQHIKEYLEMVEKGEFSIQLPRNLFIKHIFQNLEMYGQFLSDMTIQILRCKDPYYFITSDAPAVYFVPQEKVNFFNGHKALGSEHTELFFPLTKNLCLLLSRKKMEVLAGLPVGEDIVNIVNYNISNNSRSFIFSPGQAPFLEEFIENYIPYPFKMKLG